MENCFWCEGRRADATGLGAHVHASSRVLAFLGVRKDYGHTVLVRGFSLTWPAVSQTTFSTPGRHVQTCRDGLHLDQR